MQHVVLLQPAQPCSTPTRRVTPHSVRSVPLATTLLLLLLGISAVASAAALTPTTSFVDASSVSSAVATEATTAMNTTTNISSTLLNSTTERQQIRASLLEWYTSNFRENEVVLLGLPNNRTAGLPDDEKPCSQLPSVQMRSSTLANNTVCPPAYTNLSCACLLGYIRAGTNEFWEFKVRRKSPEPTTLVKQLNASSVLEIDAISTIWAPGTLRGLRINGMSDEPLPIAFIADNRALSSDLPLARSENASFALETIEIYNINMENVVENAANFVPKTVTNLMMRNCGLKIYGLPFGQGLGNIEYLDLSVNKLTYPLVGSTTTGICAACAVQTLNLTSNLIPSIPAYLFTHTNLERLYLADNPLDYNVSTAVFDGINALTAFTADGPVATAATCPSGDLRRAHNVLFCVVAADGAANNSDGTAKPTSSHVLLFAIVGCVVVALALAAFLLWQRRRNATSKDASESLDFVNTLNFDDSVSTNQARLVNDPLLITNRIPYSEVHTGQCISKGGFGLVFVGSYNGRKVAIKKIRPDLSDDLAQIELFAKEIALMAMLEHPRIVEFIGVAWDSLRHLSAVTEFMDRGDLRDVLQGFKTRGCRLTWATHKLPIAEHIAEALTYLHSLRPKKVIHRDLKSKNVLLNSDMEAKLSDFGISRERHFEETHMTAGIGTSFWIAPEVLLGKDYDERADIFSFGVVLCEIDTDDYPYWNDKNPSRGGQLQQAEILRQVALGALRPTFADDCPQAILALADSCLQADPAERPTAAEIVYELQVMLSRNDSDRSMGLDL